MFRNPVIAAGILLLAVSTRIHALGLGDIDVRSALNEPLDAVVELTSATDEQLDTLKVSIASREAFSRAGISRPLLLMDLEFAVERTPAGTRVIRISTDDPVREPYLDFLLDVAWPSGRMLRQYTVLIDPPLTMPASRPAPAAPVTPPPQPRTAAPPPSPAPRPVPVTAPAAAPVTAAPPPVPASTSSSYGPVKRNETLWQVAKRVRPDSDISMEQMMLALQRANPRAFIRNNINNLRRGAVLDVPTRDEIIAIGAAEARNEARRQHAEWRDRRSQPAGQPSEAAADVAVAPVPSPAPEPATEARLQLVAPEDEPVEGTAAPGGAGDMDTGAESAETGAALAAADELRQELALANEEAEAGRAQAGELQSRVSELESQLADMQRLLELKDEQLASIQAGLTGPADSEAEAQVPLDEDAETDELLETADSGEVLEEAPASQPLGLVDRMMNNPMLTGLGVVVAMVLGGIIWAGTRQRRSDDMFSDEPSLESQMAAAAAATAAREPARQEPVDISDRTMLGVAATEAASAADTDLAETDPVKEADIFLAYGRVQQAEDVILEGLEKDPTNSEFRLKLMEVYHAGGNTESFNSQAQSFRNQINEDDPQWQKIAVMGYEMSPDNPLYQAGSGRGASAAGVDFDMDLSGLDEPREESSAEDKGLGVDYAEGDREHEQFPDSLDFNLDELGGSDEEEDAGEGVLDSADEIGTKLDLARAYIDMGDPDGARSILEEVLEEGNDSQKSEAEGLFAKLA